jgi:glycosyltransferase involved in cell wall biosynthesis
MWRILNLILTHLRSLSNRNHDSENWLLVRLYGFLRRLIPGKWRQRFSNWLVRCWVATRPQRDVPKKETMMGNRSIRGVDVLGLIEGGTGLSEIARDVVNALSYLKIKANLFNFYDHLYTQQMEGAIAGFRELSDSGCHPITLIHATGGALPRIYLELGLEYLRSHYIIEYLLWETPRVPKEWLQNISLIDEIWTPTSFCRDIFCEAIRKPVTVIPPCITVEVPDGIGRRDFGLPEQPFIFLSMVDFSSLEVRKNPLGAVYAFAKAFGDSDRDVRFVLKSRGSDVARDFQLELAQLQTRYGSIIHIDEDLTRSNVNALIHSCDCLVSLHRSEGFGLPIAEAMYLGKPVIATGWSGNMDFMTADNSLPVNYAMTIVPRDVGPFKRGDVWAEPDLEHAAIQMRRVVEEEGLSIRIGRRALSDIRSQFSVESVAERIRERFHQLGFLVT